MILLKTFSELVFFVCLFCYFLCFFKSMYCCFTMLSDSVIKLNIYIYIYSFINIVFHYGLSQDTEYSSLSYMVGPCCLSIPCIVAYICSPQTPIHPSPNAPSLGNHKSSLNQFQRDLRRGGSFSLDLVTQHHSLLLTLLDSVRLLPFPKEANVPLKD